LIDTSRDQQQPQPQPQRRSISQVFQSPRQQHEQPRFSSAAYPNGSIHYVTTSQNHVNTQAQAQNDQCRSIYENNYLLTLSFSSSDQHLENLYYSRGPTTPRGPSLSQTIAYRPAQNQGSGSANNSFDDLNLTAPARMNTSSYAASWDPQPARRSTSNIQSVSIFGPNPFAASNPGPAQRAPVPQPPPEPTPRRNYVTSTNAARSLEGDDRPIFGGRGSGGAGRGRGRFTTFPPIQEHESSTNGLRRHNTFVLDEPSVPNLPQSGAQRARDTVVVQELYNVRQRNRAKTPVAFTINLNETSRSPAIEITERGTI
jgi:hypothetical protein